MTNKNKIFFSHQSDLSNKSPVTRSSAVFYFKSSNYFNTTIHFLNYWKVKRGIKDVIAMATVRNMGGDKFFSTEIMLPDQGAVEIEIKSLLKSNGVEFDTCEGSIELEFFSKQNLFVGYAAIVIRYSGENWHTSAHSCQRYFSFSSADKNIDKKGFAEEGNQTIQKDLNLEPFFIIHNGPNTLLDEEASLEIISYDGRKIRKNLPKISWTPNETKIFYLKGLLDYRNFLQGQWGTYKIIYKCQGVFPRLIAGFENLSNGAWSVDHTNFAASSEDINNDQFDVEKKDGFKNLVFNVPNFSTKNWNCYLDIYPTYPEGEFAIEVKRKIGIHSSVEKVSLPPISESVVTRINSQQSENTELNFLSKLRLPRRFHTGVHYSYQGSDPAFLIDGPYPHQSGPVKTRWAPIFGGQDIANYLLIANRVFKEETPIDIHYNSLIYNAFADEPLQFEFTLPREGTLCLCLEKEIEDLQSFLANKSGWIYIKSNVTSNSVFHYLSLYKDQSVTCDHAF
jgi:hypothetical protein